MDYPNKDQRWVFHEKTEAQETAPGVVRRVLAYCDNVTYVASGKFEFTIDGEVHTVSKGDTLLKQDGVMHGCTCLEDGILIDIFTPMREDFL